MTAAGFLADTFLGAGRFAGEVPAFFAATFVLAAEDFVTTVFLEAPVFFAASVCLVTTFFAMACFVATFGLLAFANAVAVPAPSIKNLVRSFTDASHAGARPRPLHVAPDVESR